MPTISFFSFLVAAVRVSISAIAATLFDWCRRRTAGRNRENSPA